jgi:hypothetical protein
MVDRLRLLAAVRMLAAPTTRSIAKWLAVPTGDAKAALNDAERFHLVTHRHTEGHRDGGRGEGHERWWLSEEGRAEMERLSDVS